MNSGERAMESHVTLIRALVASVPAGMLFAGALALFLRGRALSSLLQLLGAGGLVVVVLAHICEAVLRQNVVRLSDSLGSIETRSQDAEPGWR
jgi:hypothetical protein